MSERLLFVDDEVTVLNAIERLLAFDFDLDTADSGEAGLEAIKNRGPYPVIFTDMRMPRMNGVEFVNRAVEIAPDTIFIMLTGNTDYETVGDAENHEAIFRLLNKPCTGPELKENIADALNEYGRLRTEQSTRPG